MSATYFAKIMEFYRSRKRMPTYTEIMRITGLRSKGAVAYVVDRCIEAGFLEKDCAGKLLPKNQQQGIPILGTVAAGFPAQEEQEDIERVTLDDLLIKKRGATFLLRVKGESMRDEGIRSGDLVLVEKTNNITPGDIIVASVDGEWTVKFFRKNKGKVYLEAANPDYPSICAKEELLITLVVKAVIRKY